MVKDSELTQRQRQVLRLLAPLFSAFDYVKYGNSQEREKNLRNRLHVFAVALEDIDLSLLSGGILKCIRTKIHPPTIAEIREECASVSSELTGSGAKSIDAAWGEVRKQIHDAFIYKKPLFSTPEIKLAAERMGWTTLCAANDAEMVGNRAQFIKIYESVLQQKRTEKENSSVIDALGREKLQGLVNKTVKEITAG